LPLIRQHQIRRHIIILCSQENPRENQQKEHCAGSHLVKVFPRRCRLAWLSTSSPVSHQDHHQVCHLDYHQDHHQACHQACHQAYHQACHQACHQVCHQACHRVCLQVCHRACQTPTQLSHPQGRVTQDFKDFLLPIKLLCPGCSPKLQCMLMEEEERRAVTLVAVFPRLAACRAKYRSGQDKIVSTAWDSVTSAPR